MAGPRLEVFKFGMYVFFPIVFMTWIGDPAWYQKYVSGLRDFYNPPKELTNPPATSREGVMEQLEQLREARRARRQQQQGGASTDA
ncbi:hypothetical protein THASP1DRAFT_30325 [Thamnocephalis sphaerospora]|uniref:Protein PET100, mitochondrial n=1 Tax=Thamnocephalis sphaerospora TaxID=78915 RepID=A0A4P9XRC8_9FUNG|nr:hypothetical protein THASP1DRAFT_30325 [Thamnocephalis sphaerospora]|eukprot:RKP07870.1 hypothetical protein THASP1DRAFT_30325 [Thamnocephalis sphaerospora]